MILKQYTVEELGDYYQIPYSSMILRIIELSTNINWNLHNKWCNNDSTMNIISGELHGDMNKDDVDDPTLSYGVIDEYRCYQASELNEIFKQTPGVFPVPDYVSGVIDPLTNELMDNYQEIR